MRSSLPRILPIGALLPFGLISESYFKVTDTDSSCSVWAKAGWCQAITDLLDKCPHSCQKYGVQGASSLEERYITVNFRDSSSLAAPTFSEIVAPPPPPGGISPQSDINLVCWRYSMNTKTTASIYSGFQITVEKPKPKQLLRPRTTGTNSSMNQSQFLPATRPKRGKNHAYMVLVLRLICGKTGASLLSQSRSVAIAIT